MQGSKRKSFFTLELVVVIVVIAIILAFAIPKIFKVVDKSYELVLKADITLIKNGILKEKKRLIQTQQIYKDIVLDSANVNKIDEELFQNILVAPILSTDNIEKKAGKWAKVSKDNYIFFLQKDSVRFTLKDGNFICDGSLLCKDLN